MKTLAILFCCLSLLQTIETSGQVSPPRPNIILIIGDDMRYNSFSANGGPTWFDSPSIDRIASEGADFKNYFCVYSLCVPARSSMMTGLYPHSSGAVDNMSTYHTYLPTIGSILDSAGYHTAMIGKYHVFSVPQKGWDYWMARRGHSEDTYKDVEFNVNGIVKMIPGHVTQVIKDSVNHLLSVIDTPYFICIGQQAPHQPATSLPEDSGIYANERMPIPSNFYKYVNQYPSFLYEETTDHSEDDLAIDLENYYECLQDIEGSVADIFTLSESRNQLENTMILFTGDNGFLYGEHYLEGKGFPYEPSIRLPMFIRYPAWFTSNTVLESAMALNVDIAPTLCEAAGIDYTPYHFHGMSLHKLATGEVQRDKILYENIKLADAIETKTPSIRTIRSAHFKYNSYQCIEKTEEFFDLDLDPDENTNLISNSNYISLVNKYRIALDSMRVVFNDTLSSDTLFKDCHLVKNKTYAGSYTMTNSLPELQIITNPFMDEINLKCFTEEKGIVQISVCNLLGQQFFSEQKNVQSGSIAFNFDSSHLPNCIYCVRFSQGSNSTIKLMLKN